MINKFFEFKENVMHFLKKIDILIYQIGDKLL